MSICGVPPCPACGARFQHPSDYMYHRCPVHPALALAREGRRSGDPLTFAPPYKLYELSKGSVEVYNHALREAGHIVLKATGEPEDPCETCGWSL